MILIPSSAPHPHPHHPPHHPHHVELAQPGVPLASPAAAAAAAMPESGDIDVLTAPRIHLASRRRFDLKLDLASAVSGRGKKPRLDLLSAPALLTSRLADSVSSCSPCVPPPPVDDSTSPSLTPTTPTSCPITTTTTTTTCTFRSSPREEGGERERADTPRPDPLSVRAISSGELAAKLRKSRPVLVIDCRPFLCYNAQHVQGAVNISCTDRFNRKRLQQGKVGVLDLLAATYGKDTFRRRHFRDVVLYDERGAVQQQQQQQQVTEGGADSALHIVMATLHREGRQPAVLQGGMKQFEAEYPELCWSSRRQVEMPGRLLCSPTNDTVEPEIETATASKVLPFLYLGNERDAAELERLRRHNITYVLNVTAHVPHYWHAHGIGYKRIPASDSAQQNLKQYFEEAIEYIDEARQKGASVLIHCHAGVSRSATITIAYLLKHTKMAMSDAYKFVKGKRSIISPNFNFLGQLLEFEQDLNQGLSARVLHPRLLGLESNV